MSEITLFQADKLKILTLNTLHNTFKLTERIIQIACEIKREDPDIVCFQEILFDLENNTESSSLNTIAEITGMAVVSTDPYLPRQGLLSGTAILSRMDAIESGLGLMPAGIAGNSYNSCYSVLESDSSRPIIVFSIHGAWGGSESYLREQQFLTLDRQANELEKKYGDRSPIILLCGDFNSVPDSAAVRFLRGLASLDGKSTFWIDCWEAVGEGTGITSDPCSKLGQLTARNAGIANPESIPTRRIDYVFVKNWVYGRAGNPMTSKIFGNVIDSEGYTPSDHYGICTEIWNPSK